MKATSACAAVVVAGLLVTGCGRSSKDADDPPPAAGAVCEVVDIAHRRILEPAELTFEALVEADAWDADERAAAAAIRLLARGSSAGAYQPLIDHLVERHRVEVDRHEEPPPADAEVRRLAVRLDRSLAAGGCR